MIYKLQKKFIAICGISLLAVLFIIYALIFSFSLIQLNSVMDQITEKLLIRNDQFPVRFDEKRMRDSFFLDITELFNQDRRPNADYFSVSLDDSGKILSVDIDRIPNITVEDAALYAEKISDRKAETGWVSLFRYRVVDNVAGKQLIFVDASMNISSTLSTVSVVCIVLLLSFLVIFILITFFSKRAVKPISESYEKQKQFITDANHELKTPLTLILTNLDIIESEIGQNEWLDDIRIESERMSDLVNQLVILTRMDESKDNLQLEEFNMSALLSELYESFCPLSEKGGKKITASIAGDICYRGDKCALSRMITILLDNAVKYCDDNGEIFLSLSKEKNIVFCVENTFSDVNIAETDKFFERFYRSDKSRTYDGSFGIGLSIAKAIVQNHNGKISVYQKGSDCIGFKVILK